MFRMYASSSHSYTHLTPALGIVRKPTVWGLLLDNILAYTTLACLLGAVLKLVDEAARDRAVHVAGGGHKARTRGPPQRPLEPRRDYVSCD